MIVKQDTEPPDSKTGQEAASDAALRFVVRDMGNGVDRILSAEIVPGTKVLMEEAHADRIRLAHHYPTRISELCVEAWAAMGILPELSRSFAGDAWVMALDDHTVEVVSYRKH